MAEPREVTLLPAGRQARHRENLAVDAARRAARVNPQRMEGVDAQFCRWRATGDLDALGAVYDAAAPALLRLALHHVRQPTAAEDLVQTTFLAAIDHAARYDAARPLLGWLGGILANQAKLLQRREGRTPDAERLPAAVAPDPLAVAAAAEFTAQCDAAIEALPIAYRPVLRMHLKHELEAAEIAHVLGRPPGTVRSQIARGLELLRAALPAGISLGAFAALLPTRGLVAIRGEVLAAAKWVVAPVAAATAAGTAMSLVGMGAMMKKLLVGLAGAAALGMVLLLPQWRAANQAKSPPSGPPVALASDDRSTSASSPSAAAVAAMPLADERAAVAAVLWELTGRVLGPADQPVANARVRLGAAAGAPEQVVDCDADGRYRIDLESLRQLPTFDRERIDILVVAEGPGHRQIAAANEYQLSLPHRDPAKTMRIVSDRRLVRAPIVIGRVRNRHGAVVAGAEISVRIENGDSRAGGITSTDGGFRIAATGSGNCSIDVRHLVHGMAAIACVVCDGQDTDVGDLFLGGAELVARVVYDSDEPAVGVRLYVQEKPESGSWSSVETDANGWVRIVPKSAAPHRVMTGHGESALSCEPGPVERPPTLVLVGLRLVRFRPEDEDGRKLHLVDSGLKAWSPHPLATTKSRVDIAREDPTHHSAGKIEQRLLLVGTLLHWTADYPGLHGDAVFEVPETPNVVDVSMVLRPNVLDAGLVLRIASDDSGELPPFRVGLQPLAFGLPSAYELDLERRGDAFHGNWSAGRYRLELRPKVDQGPEAWFARQEVEVSLLANQATAVRLSMAAGGRLRVTFRLPPGDAGPIREWHMHAEFPPGQHPPGANGVVQTLPNGWIEMRSEIAAEMPVLWGPVLPPGRHRIDISAAGYIDTFVVADITARRITDVEVSLLREAGK
jgi:RNA polymerase sigma factor (sigma-70 family)